MPEAATSLPVRAPARRVRQFVARSTVSTAIIYIVLVVLCAYTAIRSPQFRSAANVETLLEQSIPLGLAAIGQLCVIVTGGLDMSVGMVGRLAALLAAVFLETQPGATPVALIIGLAAGIGIGLVNGIVITSTGAVPFIVTLGMFGVLEGVSLAVTQTSTSLVPPRYQHIYTSSIHGFPIAVIVMAVIWVLAYLFLRFMPLARDFYAIGGDPQVARTAGIRVHRVRIAAYIICAALGALAGLFLLAQSGVGNNSIAANLEFQSIVAVALGGASLFGGSGSVVGTLGAVLLLTCVTDVFQVLQISTYYQNVFQGGVILIAVLLYAGSARTQGTADG